MIKWIVENLSTIIVTAILLGICAAIIVSRIKAKKRGKSTCGCGCNCDSCPMSGKCGK